LYTYPRQTAILNAHTGPIAAMSFINRKTISKRREVRNKPNKTICKRAFEFFMRLKDVF